MHNELSCITDVTAMWGAVLDDADQLAPDPAPTGFDPLDELRVRLPGVLATFSPAARAMVRFQLDQMLELVAFAHGMAAILDHANASA